MAGTAANQIRSATVIEVTAGTTPSTPAFKTHATPIMMKATVQNTAGMSLISKGARLGNSVTAIPVSGEYSGQMVYGTADELLATLLQGAWSTDVLTDGKATATVTVENAMPAGAGGTNTMLRYRGVEATEGTISLKSQAAVELALTLVGRGSDNATTTAITGATYTDPTEHDPLSSGIDVGTIVFDGYTLDCMEALEIKLAYEGRDVQPKISSNDMCGVTRGALMPTLTARIYIEANFLAIYNAARARHTAFAVTIPIGSVTGEKYTIEFPSCYFGETDIDMSGASLIQTVQILPHYSTADGYVCSITRAVA